MIGYFTLKKVLYPITNHRYRIRNNTIEIQDSLKSYSIYYLININPNLDSVLSLG